MYITPYYHYCSYNKSNFMRHYITKICCKLYKNDNIAQMGYMGVHHIDTHTQTNQDSG